jgi:hypothetical protein
VGRLLITASNFSWILDHQALWSSILSFVSRCFLLSIHGTIYRIFSFLDQSYKGYLLSPQKKKKKRFWLWSSLQYLFFLFSYFYYLFFFQIYSDHFLIFKVRYSVYSFFIIWIFKAANPPPEPFLFETKSNYVTPRWPWTQNPYASTSQGRDYRCAPLY